MISLAASIYGQGSQARGADAANQIGKVAFGQDFRVWGSKSGIPLPCKGSARGDAAKQ